MAQSATKDEPARQVREDLQPHTTVISEPCSTAAITSSTRPQISLARRSAIL